MILGTSSPVCSSSVPSADYLCASGPTVAPVSATAQISWAKGLGYGITHFADRAHTSRTLVHYKLIGTDVSGSSLYRGKDNKLPSAEGRQQLLCEDESSQYSNTDLHSLKGACIRSSATNSRPWVDVQSEPSVHAEPTERTPDHNRVPAIPLLWDPVASAAWVFI